VTGGDVTIDRAMLDGLAEPLGHLLRNAVDHGIEPRIRACVPGRHLPGG
jgi:chemotaxis protein histidine kinase CheA